MDLMENKCNDNGLSQHLTNVHLKDDHENESEPIQRHPEPDECSTSSSDMIDRMLQTPQMQNEAIEYRKYESEWQMGEIKSLMQIGLSEPYSIYTYRYFIYNWPELCYLAYHEQKIIGAIICKFETVLGKKCGYIAMLAVNCEYRRKKIGCNLVLRSIREMQRLNAQEVVLETEITNKPALQLYENLGFIRAKRLFRYYLNGYDAFRLKLHLV